jgi:hypothetical protein
MSVKKQITSNMKLQLCPSDPNYFLYKSNSERVLLIISDQKLSVSVSVSVCSVFRFRSITTYYSFFSFFSISKMGGPRQRSTATKTRKEFREMQHQQQQQKDQQQIQQQHKAQHKPREGRLNLTYSGIRLVLSLWDREIVKTITEW